MIVAGEEEGSSSSSATVIFHTHKLNRIPNESPNPNSKIPCSDSSAVFISGNDDLLIQILVYLPIKSLYRFQSVSKRWFSIIADPFFRRLHAEASSARAAVEHGTHFLYLRRWKVLSKLNFVSSSDRYVNSMEETVSGVANSFEMGQVLGFHSCNGLAAIGMSSKGSDHVDLFVYNPATRQRKKLPILYAHDVFDLDQYDRPYVYEEYGKPVKCPHSLSEFIALYVAFDPLQSDHYTLVYAWLQSTGPSGVFLSIYKSELQAWSDQDCYIEHGYEDGIMWNAGIYWNGDLHWVSEWCFSLSFDLGTAEEHHCILPLAKRGEVYWPDIYFFGRCGGDLCAMGQKGPQSLVFDVFKLESEF